MKFVLGYVLGVIATLVFLSVTGPHCPTEDSCAYKWQDGHAGVVEVTP